MIHLAVAQPRLEIHSFDSRLRIDGKMYCACSPCHSFHPSMSSRFRIKPIIWPSLPDHKKTLEQLCKKPKKVSASITTVTVSQQPRMILWGEESLNLRFWSSVHPQSRVPYKDPVSGGRKLKWNTRLRIAQASPQGWKAQPVVTSDPEGVTAPPKVQSQLEHVG